MFNRSFQRRAVKSAGGGRKVAADAALRLPWAGIFEPWRPFVLVAEAAETLVLTKVAKLPVRPQKAANRCKKSSGRLQGVQLDMFAPDAPPNDRQSPADSRFPKLAEMIVPADDDDKPLSDLFPEAYL
jgi:hypothetical protein